MRPTTKLAVLVLVSVTTTAVVAAFNSVPARAQERPTGSTTALAQAAADRFVAGSGEAAVLLRGPDDQLVRKVTYSGGNGSRFVSYDRTYRGLPVAGGDVVVMTDAKGVVKAAATAQKSTVNVPTTARIGTSKAVSVARRQLKRVDDAAAPKLVVDAYGRTPRLAWEVRVAGLNAHHGPSKLHVFVDALTGKVLDTSDEVSDGVGNGYYSGRVTLDTTTHADRYALKDPTRPGLQCGEFGSDIPYVNDTDVWGDGSGTDLVTACADAMYAAQQETNMLRDWMGRDGIDGTGGAFPIKVGFPEVNAFWDGAKAQFGHNDAETRQATSLDVVGHELGHAIFQYTPGGANGGESGLNEGSADIWGALTEAYAKNPRDKPDYDVGEQIDLVGDGAIRSMHNPASKGDPNCYSDKIPTTETHAAAGPLNHWFYLLAEGTNPTDGNPPSPTCNGSSLTGLGIRTAGRIFYNAELLKTSNWKYVEVRVASLTAAKSLFPESCDTFDTVKAAWDAVSVPAQPGEPTCTNSPDNFTVWTNPGSVNVMAGESATTTVHIGVTGGSAHSVALSVRGLPTGATAVFSPAAVTTGDTSTVTIATAAATPSGTYTIAVTGTGSKSHSVPFILNVTGGRCGGSNDTDLDVPDAGPAVTSLIKISGCNAAPSATAKVEIHIVHPYRGDVTVKLLAPDGTVYPLRDASFENGANLDETHTVDLSATWSNGTWRLEVEDVFWADVGHLDRWSLIL